MAFVYIESGQGVDVTERLVLESLVRTYNPEAQGQADVILLCKKIFDDNAKTRVQFNKLYKYYNDEQEQIFVKDVFKPLMGKDKNGESNYDKMCRENMKPPVKIANYTTRFVNKQATLYDESPKREIEGNEDATKKYNELATKIKLDAVLQMAERYQKLFRSCFLRPTIRNDEQGKVTLDVDLLLPTFIYAIPMDDDPTRAKAYFWLIYDKAHPDNAMKADWYYISNTEFYWWDYRETKTTAPTAGTDMQAYVSEFTTKEGDVDKPQGNKLGEIGIVRLATSWVGDEIIPCPGDSLINFQDSINLIETMMINSLIYQAFPILHLKNYNNKDANGQLKAFSVGPWSVFTSMTLGGDSDAGIEWVSPATKIQEFKDTAEHAIDAYLLTQGVSKNVIMESAASGAALSERNRDIKEIRKSYINQYLGMERELYRIIAKWTNKWLTEYRLPEDGNLVVEFAEPTYEYANELEELTAWEKKLAIGLGTKREYLEEKFPDASAAVLAAKLKELDEAQPKSAFTGIGQSVKNAVSGALNEKRTDKSTVPARPAQG
jgi:hypothetical protein